MRILVRSVELCCYRECTSGGSVSYGYHGGFERRICPLAGHDCDEWDAVRILVDPDLKGIVGSCRVPAVRKDASLALAEYLL
jgi:hypothetical protein